jgi:hypothetical protein
MMRMRICSCPESIRHLKCQVTNEGVMNLASHLAHDHGYPWWLAKQKAREWYKEHARKEN